MIIRDVEDRDAEFVSKYSQEFMEYYPVDIDYDPHQLLLVLERLSEDGVFLVADDGEGVIGGVGGLVGPHYYSPMNLVGTELFLWVDKDHRDSTVGYRLLKAFEHKCKELGCRYISMTSTVLTPKFKEFLGKMDYKEAETSFLKEV